MSSITLPLPTRRALHARLMAFSPRAFELFAGELLVYLGLHNVAVTRAAGDGGIDAYGELGPASGLVRVLSGVQVKRYRRNVQRPEIDRFIGALSGQYQHGIFITTAGYAEQARVKARSSPLRIDTINGAQVVGLMGQHQLGLHVGEEDRLDEAYFRDFEAQAAGFQPLRDERASYKADDKLPAGIAVPPEQDLISLRALSYALQADLYTVRAWVERGRLVPDRHAITDGRTVAFFRRDRVETIRQLMGRAALPASGPEWREAFLAFVGRGTMSRSYKPVLLKALLRLVHSDGAVTLDALAAEFRAFYVGRRLAGLPVELAVPLLSEPAALSSAQLKRLIVTNPLERFIIQGFLQYDVAAEVVRFRPELWAELRHADVLQIHAMADEQLQAYYERRFGR